MTDRLVPCNGCTVCCRGPGRAGAPLEADDDPAEFETMWIDGRHYLAHTHDGTCVYWSPEGCSIYARRPNVCRHFDCRDHAGGHYMPAVQLAGRMRVEHVAAAG